MIYLQICLSLSSFVKHLDLENSILQIYIDFLSSRQNNPILSPKNTNPDLSYVHVTSKLDVPLKKFEHYSS